MAGQNPDSCAYTMIGEPYTGLYAQGANPPACAYTMIGEPYQGTFISGDSFVPVPPPVSARVYVANVVPPPGMMGAARFLVSASYFGVKQQAIFLGRRRGIVFMRR